MDKRIELVVAEEDVGKWEWRIVRINEDGSLGEILGSEVGYDTELEARQAGVVSLDLLAV